MGAFMKASRWIDWALAFLIVTVPLYLLMAGVFQEGAGRDRLVAEAGAAPSSVAQVFFDRGGGFNEKDSAVARVDSTRRRVEFPVPSGPIRAIRLDPSRAGGVYDWSNLRIERNGRVLTRFAPTQVRATNAIETLEIKFNGVRASAGAQENDPQFEIVLTAPLEGRRMRVRDHMATFAQAALITALLFGVGISLARRLRRPLPDIVRHRPAMLLVAAITLAGVASCYPVVFFGKSFMAPNIGATPLVYDFPPYAPGASDSEPREYARFADVATIADVGAMPWQNRPWSEVEHASIFQQGEWPFWNRYNNGGLPLLGQSSSMVGDPLHWIVIAADSAAWAWDVKFVLARILFALGTALAAWLLTRNHTAAAAVGVSCCFIGVFVYRLNHPSYFTFCYGPWILVSWLWLARAHSARAIAGAVALMAGASSFMLNGGGTKEATVSLLVLHAAGALILAFDASPRGRRGARLIAAMFAGLAFLALSGPMLLAFVDSLGQAYTAYDKPYAEQLPLWRIGGLFEDLVYLLVRPQSYPTLNLVIGFCVCWAIADIRALWRDGMFRATLLGCTLPVIAVYGFLPESLLLATPLLRNIYHLPSSFSFSLIVLLACLGAFGLRSMLEQLRAPDWYRRYAIAAGLLVLLIVAAGLGDQSAWRVHGQHHREILISAVLLLAITLMLPLALRWTRLQRPFAVSALCILLVGISVVHARNGMQLRTGIDAIDSYVVNVGPRPDFNAKSPGLEALPDPQANPYRVIGIATMMFPGYGAAEGIEMMAGPDPLRSRRYEDLLAATGWPNSTSWEKRMSGEQLAAFAPVLDMLNVRYMVGASGEAGRWPSNPAIRATDLDLIERPSAWPRAFFTTDVGVYRTASDVAQRLMSSRTPTPFALLEESAAARLQAAGAAPGALVAPARSYRLGPSGTSFEIDAPAAGVVVLTENWFRGVRVLVDGVERPVELVNNAFRGVIIQEAGTHRISFTFRPWYAGPVRWIFRLGVLLFLALSVAAVLLLERRWNRASGA